ncbi:FAD dependent oxidoreductase-like protein superfamily [Pleomassaria siparia CBS 279.74]|uniref:FAD dependent oxidoreductase-like protein superfamily n=1 Tax=Pleomassaria siparia CBS 279.74 TaxID=1314801 RepID=A0A6G1KJD8_9PLEO|nr:FAD dependent oxidoreductase-like protein superfamily [Pleomassaria siparia CBS 279.74]
MATVILGSGIMGLSTAYYLSQSGSTKPEDINLVDSSDKLLHCASGFAGGFLAEDWYAPSVAPLGALSFRLHRELAEANDGGKIWGYSTSTGISLSQDSEAAVGGSGEDWLRDGTSRANAAGKEEEEAVDMDGPKWLKRVEGGSLEVITRDGSNAQIDPLRFCTWLLERCTERGVKMTYPAKAVGVLKDDDGCLSKLRISKDGTETTLSCNRLVITAGAWSPRLFNTLFPSSSTKISISQLAGHSLLLKNHFFNPKDEKEICHAVFATDTLGFSPEYFSRAGGEVYLAGLNSTMIPLPEVASDVKVIPAAIKQLKDCAISMMGTVESKEVEVMREALCFRPVTGSGRPIVSRISDNRLGSGIKTRGGGEGGVFIAGGHGAWGISQGPGTGLCLAELIEGKQISANISALCLP